MKQKLALACTLVHEPRMLVLDEPTTGVDPVSRREFWKLLAEFLSQGLTIVMATPYLDEAERCARVALLHEGRLLALDEPATSRGRDERDDARSRRHAGAARAADSARASRARARPVVRRPRCTSGSTSEARGRRRLLAALERAGHRRARACARSCRRSRTSSSSGWRSRGRRGRRRAAWRRLELIEGRLLMRAR